MILSLFSLPRLVFALRTRPTVASGLETMTTSVLLSTRAVKRYPYLLRMHGICVFNLSRTYFQRFILTHRYDCTGHVLTVSSASHLLDTGNYCCVIDSESEGNGSRVCIDIHVAIRGELL